MVWKFCEIWFFYGNCLPGLFVLKFYGPVNPMGSCRARSVYLTTVEPATSRWTEFCEILSHSVGYGMYAYLVMTYHTTRAVEIPWPTCPTCLISLRTSKKFQFTCLRQGLHSSSLEKSPGYDIYCFLFHKENMLWYALEAPHWGTSNEYPQNMFSLRIKKNINLQASKYFLEKWMLTIYLSVDK